MFDDSFARGAMRSALLDLAVPLFDIQAIRKRVPAHAYGKPTPSPSMPIRRFAASAAIATIAVLSVASRAPAIVQSIESRLHSALVAAGVDIGLPVTIVSTRMQGALKPTRVTLDEARRLANFRLVPPAGLPPDVVKREIFAEPLLVSSARTHAWSMDGEQITFVYGRADGRSFDLIADRFSPTSVPVPHYIYDLDELKSIRTTSTVIKSRHEHFVWLSGDQALHAVVSSALTVDEAMRIGQAMRGMRLPSYDGPNPRRSRIVKFYGSASQSLKP